MAGEPSICSALQNAISKNCDDSIIKNLKSLISNIQNVEFKDTTVIKALSKSENKEILKLTYQAIAEAAKTTEKRDTLTDSDIIKTLLLSLNSDDTNIVIQSCRALGNLCYESDDARQHVTDHNGLAHIFKTLEKYLNDETNNNQLLNVACGFLLNYLMSNESAQKNALQLNVLDLIEKIVRKKIISFSSTEDLFTHLLLTLNVLIENSVDFWFTSDLVLDLVNILKLSVNPEISELCLEILHGQAENDDTKMIVANAGLCELLYQLLEQYKTLAEDEDSRALMKLACDLIVLILTGDESMELLYNEANGKVYNDMISWLDSDDMDLLITGVLAVGNFARNDTHCIQMVENGVSEKLLGILSKHNKDDGEIRLQHALLSALRNLVIPTKNKSRMLENGLIDIIYPMTAIEQYPVVFKLLGTLRMAIDGQDETALQLVSKSEFLEKIVDWCLNSDHPGVRAEAPRLLAWLIKHCRSSQPYRNIIKVDGSVKCLVEMIPSPHAVMHNEALLALNLLCYTCITEICDNEQNKAENCDNVPCNLAEKIVDADVGKCIAFLINKYSDKMDRQIVENLLTLLEFSDKSTVLKEHMFKSEVAMALKKFLERENLKTLSERIENIAKSIEAG